MPVNVSLMDGASTVDTDTFLPTRQPHHCPVTFGFSDE